jgi:ATP-dependent helicase/nuclease subunit A
MKLRVRHELEQRRAGELDPVVKARLGEVDRGWIALSSGAIHAFRAQLLRRRPVDAGVDPVFQELAQPDAFRGFSRVFQRWVEQRLTSPSPVLLHAFARLSWREDHDLSSNT